jgi:hypothetical protein
VFGKQQHNRNIYTHAVSSKKRRAESKVVEMILPEEKRHRSRRVRLSVYCCVSRYRADFQKSGIFLGMNGGDDGTRTRGLCRDRAATEL